MNTPDNTEQTKIFLAEGVSLEDLVKMPPIRRKSDSNISDGIDDYENRKIKPISRRSGTEHGPVC